MKKESMPVDETTPAEGETQDGAEAGAQQRVAELEAENQQLRDKALRSVAELENFRRRAQQERQQTLEYANEQLLEQLLPIVDDFERSIAAGEQTPDFETLFRGIQLVNGNLHKLFERLGVAKIDAVGKPFDVNYHEAIMRQPSDLPEDAVVTVVEAGYTYHDKVLRHAKVIVSAG